MQYVGSKNRLSKELVPIIQSYINENTKGYLEPFVGGANIIDKIQCNSKIGCDIHEELIELLKYSQTNKLPDTISEEEYKKVKDNKDKYPKWYVGLVGFCGSFGAKYFGGFARRYNKDGTLFDVPKQAINSLRKQSDQETFKNIKFLHSSFLDLPIDKIKNHVIYCDIPYRGTTKYGNDKNFDYDKFWNWIRKMSRNNIVLVSEYNAPNDFKCIFEKTLTTTLDKNSRKKDTEKLFIYNIY